MTLIIAYHDGSTDLDRFARWEAAFRPYLDDFKLVDLASEEAEKAIAALVWTPPEGRLAALPKLRMIQSLGQGVDHLLTQSGLPDVPISRLVDPDMSHTLSQWIIAVLLDHLRDGPAYRAKRQNRDFSGLLQNRTFKLPVAVYGIGAIGEMVARRLDAIGFEVYGWSRSKKQIDGVECLSGPDGFLQMLGSCAVHISVLPLTDETRHLFDAKAFAAMPDGAYFINGGRGAQVVEADLLAAVQSGHLAGAALDVFETEPLPADHPFWSEERIAIWPHVAAQTSPETSAEQVAQSILNVSKGLPPLNQIDVTRGY